MVSRICAALFLLAVAAPAYSDDSQSDRDRRAKAALALAASRPVTVAPAPRATVSRSYPEGYRIATEKQLPLVVFVGTIPRSIEGAVVAKCDHPKFGVVEGPAVVVTYPVGQTLLIEAAIPGEVDPALIAKKVDAARKKIETKPVTKDAVAPKPLEWDVRADQEQELQAIDFRPRRGASSSCESGSCAVAPVAVSVAAPVAVACEGGVCRVGGVSPASAAPVDRYESGGDRWYLGKNVGRVFGRARGCR